MTTARPSNILRTLSNRPETVGDFLTEFPYLSHHQKAHTPLRFVGEFENQKLGIAEERHRKK
jgi:hypothetical protein